MYFGANGVSGEDCVHQVIKFTGVRLLLGLYSFALLVLILLQLSSLSLVPFPHLFLSLLGHAILIVIVKRVVLVMVMVLLRVITVNLPHIFIFSFIVITQIVIIKLASAVATMRLELRPSLIHVGIALESHSLGPHSTSLRLVHLIVVGSERRHICHAKGILAINVRLA